MGIRSSAWGLLALGLILAIGIAVIAVFPFPQTINVDEGGASGTITIPDRYVVFNGACQTVRWNVENIQAIRLNGLDAVGSDAKPVCFDDSEPPQINLTFVNGNEMIYPLTVVILSRITGVWIAAGVSIASLMIGIWLLVSTTLSSEMGLGLRLLRGLETTVIITGITLLMLEGGFRLWVAVAGSENEKLLYTASNTELAAAARRFVSMPFVTYGLPPTQEDINPLGYRGGDVELPKPATTYRILALGGSTTYGYNLTSDQAWTTHLERILREDYGHSQVEVINGGVEGYQTWNSLTNFAFRGLELDPDLVMIYHGVNDSIGATTLSPDCYAGYNLNRGLGNTRDWFFDIYPMSPSAFIRFAVIQLELMPNPFESEAIPVAIGAFSPCDAEIPSDMTDSERAEMNNLDYFERNIRSIVYLANGYDIDIMLSTFASRDLLNPDEELTTYRDQIRMKAQNDLLRSLATELDVLFYDLEREWAYDPQHWQGDIIHQTAEGTIAQAQQYATYLERTGVIPEPDGEQPAN